MKSLLKGLILLLLVFSGGVSFAQTNTNIKTFEFKDSSPGVVGSLKITTESISEDKGVIAIYGNLQYDFPPQPQNITFTIKNIDGKGSFKDFTISSTSLTPDNINIAIIDIPLDKTSSTKTLATSDRFQITSSVDRGIDFFFKNSGAVYINFNKYTPLPNPGQTGGQQGGSNTSTTTSYIGELSAKSLAISGVRPLTKKDPNVKGSTSTAEVEFAALTFLPQGYPLPAYINFILVDQDKKPLNSLIGEWKPLASGSAQLDGSVLGASKHTMIVESGKTYNVQTWISNNPGMLAGEGIFLGDFTINADYIFGTDIGDIRTPGLAQIDQSKIDSAWNSLTSTFEPGSIDFFTIGGTGVSATGGENSYIFLSKIPGLANSTVTNKSGTYEAFDPTQEGAFSKYISIIINMIYGFIALAAVINIIYFGFSLMISSSTPFAISQNKSRIWNSLIALGIALGTYLILNTINPNLTKFDISLNKVEITGEKLNLAGLSSDSELPDNYIGAKGIGCDKCFAYPVNPNTCPGNQKRGDHGGYGGAGELGGNSADLACPTGTRIQSVAPGVVYSAGSGCKDGNKKCNGGMGNYVIIKHDQGNGKPWYSIYMHLSKVEVRGTEAVTGRQQIGSTGNTGDSTGPHLHFETTNENIGLAGKQKYKNCVLYLTCGNY